MEEKTFVGYGYGRFKTDRDEMQEYCNVFMLEDFNGATARRFKSLGESGDITIANQLQIGYNSIVFARHILIRRLHICFAITVLILTAVIILSALPFGKFSASASALAAK